MFMLRCIYGTKSLMKAMKFFFSDGMKKYGKYVKYEKEFWGLRRFKIHGIIYCTIMKICCKVQQQRFVK